MCFPTGGTVRSSFCFCFALVIPRLYLELGLFSSVPPGGWACCVVALGLLCGQHKEKQPPVKGAALDTQRIGGASSPGETSAVDKPGLSLLAS